tara:strand:+ start:209 stop:430 length:222 start_codon:yes stop_codon:yes gene_type:complete
MKKDTLTQIEIDARYMTVESFVAKHGENNIAYYWEQNSKAGRCLTDHDCLKVRNQTFKARQMKFAKWANLTAN